MDYNRCGKRAQEPILIKCQTHLIKFTYYSFIRTSFLFDCIKTMRNHHIEFHCFLLFDFVLRSIGNQEPGGDGRLMYDKEGVYLGKVNQGTCACSGCIESRREVCNYSQQGSTQQHTSSNLYHKYRGLWIFK